MPIGQILGRLIGTSGKTGIKVFEQIGKSGQRVLTSYKPGANVPFKKITFAKNVTRNAFQRTSNLHSRNVEQLNVLVEQTGKKPINIDISTDHWLYNGLPSRSYTRGLRVQDGVADQSFIKNIYHAGQCKSNSITVFNGNDIINNRYF